MNPMKYPWFFIAGKNLQFGLSPTRFGRTHFSSLTCSRALGITIVIYIYYVYVGYTTSLVVKIPLYPWYFSWVIVGEGYVMSKLSNHG